MSVTAPPSTPARPRIEVRDKTPDEKKFALAANEISILFLIVAMVAVAQAFPFPWMKWTLATVFGVVLLIQTMKRPAVALALIVFASPAIELIPINLAPAVNTETLIGGYMLVIWWRAHQLYGRDPVHSSLSRTMGIYTVLVLAACINGWLLWHGSLMEMIANAKNHLVYIVALPVAFHTLRDRRDQNLVLLAASFSLFCNFLQGINYSKDAFLTGNLERRRAQALIAIQPNAFGAAIAMYFSIFLLLALYKVGSRGTRLWYWILTLTGGFTLILTLSRGSWMGVAAGIAVAALFRARRLLIVIAIAGLTYQLWLPQQAIDRAQSTIEQDGEFEGEIEGSTAMRIEQYKSLPAMMAPKPVFGWGYKSFPRVFEKYGTLKRAKGAHSSYCQYGTEMGVIGLVALVAVLARVFWTGVRAARFAPHPMHQWIGVGIMAGIVAMAVSMGSGARWDPQKMFVFFWCFVAIAERETALALLPGNARRYGGQAPAVAADDQGS